MKIEIDEPAAWTLTFLGIMLMFTAFVYFATEAGKHEREAILKAKTCEQVMAINGGIRAEDIIICQKK